MVDAPTPRYWGHPGYWVEVSDGEWARCARAFILPGKWLSYWLPDGTTGIARPNKWVRVSRLVAGLQKSMM